jgi:hypothetical protein
MLIFKEKTGIFCHVLDASFRGLGHFLGAFGLGSASGLFSMFVLSFSAGACRFTLRAPVAFFVID